MKSAIWGSMLGLLLVANPSCFASEEPIAPDLARINDNKVWTLVNAECDTVLEGGKRAVHLQPKGPLTTASNIGLALVEGLEFAEGTVEVDLKGKGKSDRCFLGVAFNVADGKTFEAVYFRPFNFLADDKVFRAHGVQYVAWPDHTWEELRRRQPGKFESAVKPAPDPSGWFHARVEVTKHKVMAWVDGAKEPCLVVDRLTTGKNGKLGLWVDSHSGAFSNLAIRRAK